MANQISLREKSRPITSTGQFHFTTEALPITNTRRIVGRQNRILTPIEGYPINVFRGNLPERLEISGTYRRVQTGQDPLLRLKLWSMRETALAIHWPGAGLTLPELSDWLVERVEETQEEIFDSVGQVVPWKVILVRNTPRVLPAPTTPDVEDIQDFLPLGRILSLDISYPFITPGRYQGNVLMSWEYTDDRVDYFGWQTARAGQQPANENTISNTSLRRSSISFRDGAGNLDYGQLSQVRMWAGSDNYRQPNSPDTAWVLGFQPFPIVNLELGTIDPSGPAAPFAAITWRDPDSIIGGPDVRKWQFLFWQEGDTPAANEEDWVDAVIQVDDEAPPLRKDGIRLTDLILTSGTDYTISIRAISLSTDAPGALMAYGALNFTAP